ncbi:hypothetical protein H4582DRAFT_1211497 [Lactarius indigo]|nr:hypothetical protein H4582DRAFT_1211497 [Lactarius indigo]
MVCSYCSRYGASISIRCRSVEHRATSRLNLSELRRTMRTGSASLALSLAPASAVCTCLTPCICHVRPDRIRDDLASMGASKRECALWLAIECTVLLLRERWYTPQHTPEYRRSHQRCTSLLASTRIPTPMRYFWCSVPWSVAYYFCSENI